MAVEAGVPTEFGDLFAELAGEVASGSRSRAVRRRSPGPRSGSVCLSSSSLSPSAWSMIATRSSRSSHPVTSLQRKAVPQLRTKVAFLGVHRPDERELGGMADADAVALDPVVAARGGVEEYVHEMVVEQIHLVHVEDAAVRAGEQAGVELVVAVERVGHRQRADDAVPGRTEGERHEWNRTSFDRRV